MRRPSTKRMILDLVEAGRRIYPCAASNFCWFHTESALCTDGDQPILKHCNPGACSNSITPALMPPAGEKVKHDCEDLMGQKPQAEPYRSSAGHSYSERRDSAEPGMTRSGCPAYAGIT